MSEINMYRAAGVRATASYIGNSNLSRESRGKSANNIVRAAEHASRMKINLSSRPPIFAHDKRNNLQQRRESHLRFMHAR